MPITYREDKATQAAARLLHLAGGSLNHMKLIKLLYLADRRALLQYGRPITFDWYVSMPHGPVLSFTLDRINDSPSPRETSYWHRFISERRENEVALLGDVPPRDQLSPAEEQLLDAVWQEFGKMNQWDLRDYSHTLPEWRDPKGSSLPIEIRDILLGEGFSEEEAREVLDTLNAEEFAARLSDA
jgi:uncharacterized phage-associated protein